MTAILHCNNSIIWAVSIPLLCLNDALLWLRECGYIYTGSAFSIISDNSAVIDKMFFLEIK